MNVEKTIEILKVIANEQQTTSAVELTIGTAINGQVVRGGVYIKDCAANIIKALGKEGFSMSMDNGKLSVWRFLK